jgi:mannan endo-1,4-beta-mannosidase
MSRRRRRNTRVVLTRVVVIAAALITVAAAVLVVELHGRPTAVSQAPPAAAAHPKPRAFLGVYTPGVPQSYAGIQAFTAVTGVRPGVVVYYSGWMEQFQVRFAEMAARHHAVPLVQIDPTGISLRAIAAGRYDPYLRSYADAVRAFGSKVIISFGHEMNGHWYSWAYQHTSPAEFVAAWRHIVTVFRQQGTRNVTWLWAVNVIDTKRAIPNPGQWWPGRSYVDWVGIDGYYLKPSWTFASLFGPTIKAIRKLTLDPIMISETSVAPIAGKPAKIADLFEGARDYGLIGFVWFNANSHGNWSISDPAASAAFRRGARTYQGSVL